MSNDCKECKNYLQENKKRKSLNQMTEEERVAYWENYRKLMAETPTEGGKIAIGETISQK